MSRACECGGFDAGRLTKIILEMADRPQDLARFRDNARRTAVEEFSADKACSRFRAALEPFVGRAGDSPGRPAARLKNAVKNRTIASGGIAP